MLISHKFDHEHKIIVTVFTPEEVTFQLFLKSFMEYQEELRYLPDYQDYNELVDFRNITKIKFNATGLKEFGRFTLASDENRNVTKLALLVESRPAFTLAKVYETFRNINPSSKKRVKVFRDIDRAYAWLTKKTAGIPASGSHPAAFPPGKK